MKMQHGFHGENTTIQFAAVLPYFVVCMVFIHSFHRFIFLFLRKAEKKKPKSKESTLSLHKETTSSNKYTHHKP